LLYEVAVNPAAGGSIVLIVASEVGATAYGGLEYTDGTDIYTTGVKVTVVEAVPKIFNDVDYPGVEFEANGNDGSRTNNKWDADPAG
jgi:hypothetical protein